MTRHMPQAQELHHGNLQLHCSIIMLPQITVSLGCLKYQILGIYSLQRHAGLPLELYLAKMASSEPLPVKIYSRWLVAMMTVRCPWAV